jgi:hypothetical protein
MRFLLFAGEDLVGWSALEGADPPMGCVNGIFYPNGNYQKIKEVICEYSLCCALGLQVSKEEYERSWAKVEALGLVVKPEEGPPFEPIGGVSLIDYAEELGDKTGRELRVLGLHHEVFFVYFREAHEEYHGSQV